MRKALRSAMKRGVKVRIIVPGEHIDFDLVRYASRADWGELLEAGALIHEFTPTMFHAKGLIVDRQHLRPRVCRARNRGVRAKPTALQAHHPGPVERAVVAREGVGERVFSSHL